MKISVIIRVYNEQKHIGEVLEALSNQNYQNYEIILVDSESTDKTVDIANKYDTKIVEIKKKDFNYSYASNVGAEYASGDILCYLSGHSVPENNDFLTEINNTFKDSLIGGCYGEVLALNDGSLVEKLFNYFGYLKCKNKSVTLETEIRPGILSCSNACIRRELWKAHPFREELGKGGEDVEMAYRIIQDGYQIAHNPNILVRHSHGSGLIKFCKEFKNWRIMYDDVLEYIKVNS